MVKLPERENMQKAYIVQNEEDFQNLMETIEIFERDDSKNSFITEMKNCSSLDYEELWGDFVKKMLKFDIVIEHIAIENQIVLITKHIIINEQECRDFLAKNLSEEKKFFQLIVNNEKAAGAIICVCIILKYYDIVLKIIQNTKFFNVDEIAIIEMTFIDGMLLEKGITVEPVRIYMQQRILLSILRNDDSAIEIMKGVNPKLIEAFNLFITKARE